MNNTNPLEQGDVLLIPLQGQVNRPYYAKIVQPRNGRLVLAEGETTGHTHGFDISEDGPEITLWTQSEYSTRRGSTERRYLRIDGGVAYLTHDEHGEIELEPGTYEVRMQTEFSPNYGQVRVAD